MDHFGHLLGLARAETTGAACVVCDSAGRVLATATTTTASASAALQHPAMVAIERVAEEARKRRGFLWGLWGFWGIGMG